MAQSNLGIGQQNKKHVIALRYILVGTTANGGGSWNKPTRIIPNDTVLMFLSCGFSIQLTAVLLGIYGLKHPKVARPIPKWSSCGGRATQNHIYIYINHYVHIYIIIYIYELRTKLFVWGNAITKCGGPPIGYQDFGCSGHQHKSRSMQFTLWDDVICYMIEKMQAWFCMESELQESKSRCTSSFWQQNTNNNW